LLNDQCVKGEIRKLSFLEFNENENKSYQNLWDTAKAVLKGKFIAMSAYIKRTERSQINNLMLHQTPRKTRTSRTQNQKNERNHKKQGPKSMT
jgi:hypothetical protein